MPTVQRKRHIVKAITWRIIASFTTFFIAWGVTGDIKAGLTFGIIDVVVKFVLYYLHERVWYRSKFGVDINEKEKK